MQITDTDGRELWTSTDVLRYLAELGRPITDSTWRSYVAREQAPLPVDSVGSKPLWLAADVQAWGTNRPGQGSRKHRASQ